MIPQSEADMRPVASGGMARFGYAGLVVLLMLGGWVRFNDRLAAVPGVPQAPAQAQAMPEHAVRGVVQAQGLPAAQAGAAVAAMGLPASEAAALAQAVKDDRVRLVRLPLYDAKPDGAARAVTVATAGFSRVVRLGPEPVVVTLPIDRAGTITFHSLSPQGVTVGAVTAIGPLALPFLARSDRLDVGVVVE